MFKSVKSKLPPSETVGQNFKHKSENQVLKDDQMNSNFRANVYDLVQVVITV